MGSTESKLHASKTGERVAYRKSLAKVVRKGLLALAIAVVALGPLVGGIQVGSEMIYLDWHLLPESGNFRYSGLSLAKMSPALRQKLPQSYITVPVWYVALLLAAYPIRSWLRERSLRKLRSANGRCMKCAYDLYGNVSGICPECGTPTAGNMQAHESFIQQ